MTCPTCSSRLKVALSTRIIGGVPGTLFVVLVILLSRAIGTSFSPVDFLAVIVVYIAAFAIFYPTVFYSKLFKFKIGNQRGKASSNFN
jgi:hypothetical protein